MVKSRPLISQTFVVFGGFIQREKKFLDNLWPKHLFRIGWVIQNTRSWFYQCSGSGFNESGSGSRVLMTKTAEFFFLFLIKNCNFLIPRPPYRTSKLQEKPSALKREHQTLPKMKCINFFLFSGSFLPSWIRIAIPDPDTGNPLNPNPDPQHCLGCCYIT